MGAARTPWHFCFGLLLVERGSPDFQVESEVPLLGLPPRADFLLLRKKRRGPPRPGRVLRGLWGRIEDVALVELKTLSHPLRRGDVGRWLAVTLLYDSQRRASSKGTRTSTQGVLIVPRATPTLFEELEALGLRAWPDSPGYYTLSPFGFGLSARLLILDEVARREHDELLELFASRTLNKPGQLRWLAEHGTRAFETMGKRLLSNKDFIEAFLAAIPVKQRMKGLTPAQQLELIGALPPEQRLADLTPEQQFAHLTTQQLGDALAALPAARRREVTKRLATKSTVKRVRTTRAAPATKKTRSRASTAR